MAYIKHLLCKVCHVVIILGRFFVIKSISRDIENKLHIMQSRE